MKKTEQQQINKTIGECLEDLSESMEMSAKNRDLMMRLIEFGDTRIDSLENKIDILMSERAEAVTQTKEDDVWYNEESKKKHADVLSELEKEIEKMFPEVDETEYLTSSKANADNLNAAMKEFYKSCDEHLDRVAETEITPKALLKLGFEEEYQPPIDNQAGYLYYSFKMWGIELLSNASDEEGWYVFNDENNEIHNLRKLGDLVLSLNEL